MYRAMNVTLFTLWRTKRYNFGEFGQNCLKSRSKTVISLNYVLLHFLSSLVQRKSFIACTSYETKGNSTVEQSLYSAIRATT